MTHKFTDILLIKMFCLDPLHTQQVFKHFTEEALTSYLCDVIVCEAL